MRNIVLQPTSTAHWHALIRDAEHKSRRTLGEEVQSYLVFLLQRFLSRPEIAAHVLALDYLRGLRSAGRNQYNKLREVGDICLLHAGFFPQRARRRRVSVNYYVDLGIGAYYQLHHHTPHHQGQLYASLCEGFVPAMDVLQAIRVLDGKPLLDALSAHELWEHTGSTQARRRLQETTDSTPVPSGMDLSALHRH